MVDYQRYQPAKYQPKDIAEKYRLLLQKSEKLLKAYDVIRLMIALNYSCFVFESGKTIEAIEIAEDGLNDALDELDGGPYTEKIIINDAKQIIDILKENLSYWRDEEDAGDEGVP